MRYAKVFGFIAVLFVVTTAESCERSTADTQDRERQERIQQESSSQVGMPAIKNFREKKLLKDIYELRDQAGLVTYTYTFSEQTGRKQFFCDSVGYGIPYSAQFSNPEKLTNPYGGVYQTLPQSEPNALFTPASADGTWVMCKDPNGRDVKPVYVEPKVIVSPFKLPSE